MERVFKGIWIPVEIWQDKSLSWNEKILLMEIDSFTTQGMECYFSNEFIADLLGVTERYASKCLSRLIDSGFVRLVRFDGRKRYVESTFKFQAGWNESSMQGGTKVPGRVEQKFHHTNINETNKSNKKDTINKARFDFKSSLLSLGVSEEVAEAWMSVRKTKRATNTEIAFRKVAEEIQESGKTAEECITIAVENSWQGFKAEWIAPKPQRQYQPRQKESVYAHNLKVMDQMYGTHLYEKAYGRRQPDEQ